MFLVGVERCREEGCCLWLQPSPSGYGLAGGANVITSWKLAGDQLADGGDDIGNWLCYYSHRNINIHTGKKGGYTSTSLGLRSYSQSEHIAQFAHPHPHPHLHLTPNSHTQHPKPIPNLHPHLHLTPITNT